LSQKARSNFRKTGQTANAGKALSDFRDKLSVFVIKAFSSPPTLRLRFGRSNFFNDEVFEDTSNTSQLFPRCEREKTRPFYRHLFLLLSLYVYGLLSHLRLED
jgi:hypothetical protein